MKKFRAGVVGVGFIGVLHIEALRRLGNVEVVAICDPFDVDAKKEKHHIPKGYVDYKEMIDSENLDFVHICTPNVTHFEIAKYAFEHGVQVIIEKPVTFTTKEAYDLVDIAKKHELKNAVCFHNRFYAATAYMKDFVERGELGDLISVHGMYIQDWLLYDTDYSWRLEKEQSGITRVVADVGSHWLDLIEYITGEKIIRVFADFKTLHPQRKKPKGVVEAFSTENKGEYELVDIDTEDVATISFELEEGAIGNCIVSQVFAGKKNKIVAFISGQKASLEWDLNQHEDVIVGYRSKPNKVVKKDFNLMNQVNDLISYPAGHAEGYPDTFKQLFNQVYNDTGNRYATLEDGYRQMVLNDAIYESAHNERWAYVEDYIIKIK